MKLGIKEVFLAASVVGVLVYLWRGLGLSVFELPLIMGQFVCMVLITGPHGGTLGEERAALIVGPIVNWVFYTLGFWIVKVAIRTTRHPRTLE